MAEDATIARALEGVIVLEFGGTRTHYCGKLLAEMGAEVLLIEPMGGLPSRLIPPVLSAGETDGGASSSIAFQYLNTSKRSVVLDFEDEAQQDTLRQLARRADLVLNPHLPGFLEQYDLSLADLRAENPALVTVSITPFGETGPLAACEAPDLVTTALGGLMELGGYVDDTPLGLPYDQASVAAGGFAAVAALMALRHSETTGDGQHVDVSVQQCVAMALENSVQFYELEGRIRRRTGGQQRVAGTGTFATTDGYVFVLAAGVGGNRFWPNLVRWMREESVPGAEELEGEHWAERAFLDSQEAKETFARAFAPYAAQRTKQEVYERSQIYRVPCAPVNDAAGLLANEQLQSRAFFHDVELAPGRVAPAPGAPYQLSVTPWRSNGRAPAVDEDRAWAEALLSESAMRYAQEGTS